VISDWFFNSKYIEDTGGLSVGWPVEKGLPCSGFENFYPYCFEYVNEIV